jgi:hypothetical protein
MHIYHQLLLAYIFYTTLRSQIHHLHHGGIYINKISRNNKNAKKKR